MLKHKDCILLNMINRFRFETTSDLLTMCVCVQSGIPRSTLFFPNEWIVDNASISVLYVMYDRPIRTRGKELSLSLSLSLSLVSYHYLPNV